MGFNSNSKMRSQKHQGNLKNSISSDSFKLPKMPIGHTPKTEKDVLIRDVSKFLLKTHQQA